MYSSLTDDNFVTLINKSVPLWLNEFNKVTDKRLVGFNQVQD